MIGKSIYVVIPLDRLSAIPKLDVSIFKKSGKKNLRDLYL
jgi:hypothetical protein